MEKYLIKQSRIHSKLKAPPSKSHSLRAILFASMAKGKSIIEQPLFSPDSLAMITACRDLGAKITVFDDHLEIIGVNGNITPLKKVDVKNSGIVLRFIAAIGALSDQPFLITGDKSICERRIFSPLLDAIKQLGGNYKCLKKKGFAPARVCGPIHSGIVKMQGMDSQPISAILIASIFLKEKTIIQVENPGEIPWVNLTLSWLDYLDVPYVNEGFLRYEIFGKKEIKEFYYKVQGDFSSALFPVALAVLTDSEFAMENLFWNDPQGDKIAFMVLQKMGANIEIYPDRIEVKKGSFLKGIEISINECIDAVCMLAVVSCYARGKTIIKGAKIARSKESNRLVAINSELKKMGAKIEEFDDGLMIEYSPLKGARVSSYKDHRIAMALSVAGLVADGVTEVEDTKCVNKTYPNFINNLKKIGANILCH